jgi:elongation factor Ts
MSLADIKKLRDETSAAIVDVKEALDEANGDLEEAKKILHKKGQKVVDKKAGRESNEGLVESYIHTNGKIGVLVKVMCETDFVARNEDFKAFAHDVAIQIAASAPKYISADEVPDEAVEEEKEIIVEQARKEGKPEEVIEKIVAGKVSKIKDEFSLLSQPLVKDPEKTVKELLTEVTAKLGEKIEIGEFVRYEL